MLQREYRASAVQETDANDKAAWPVAPALKMCYETYFLDRSTHPVGFSINSYRIAGCRRRACEMVAMSAASRADNA